MKENVKHGIRQTIAGSFMLAGAIYCWRACLKVIKDDEVYDFGFIKSFLYFITYFMGMMVCSISVIIGIVLMVLGIGYARNEHFYDDTEEIEA